MSRSRGVDRPLVALLVVVVVAWSASCRLATVDGAAPATLRIGGLYPLSGVKGFDDAYCWRAAAALAAAAVNNDSSVLPHTRVLVSAVDDRGEQPYAITGTLQLLCKLAGQGAGSSSCAPVDMLLGPPYSANAMVSQQVAQLYNVTQVSAGASDPALSVKVTYPTFSRTRSPVSLEGTALAHVVTAVGWSHVSVLYSSHPLDQAIAQQFMATLPPNVTVVAVQRFLRAADRVAGGAPNADLADLTARMSMLRSAGSYVIVVFLRVTEVSLFFTVRQNLGMTGAPWVFLTSSNMYLELSAYPQFNPLYAGLIGVYDANPTVGSPVYDAFLSQWHAARIECNNGPNPTSLSLNTYDAVWLMARGYHAAIVAAGNNTPPHQAVLQHVRQTSFQGVSGPVALDANGDRLPYLTVSYMPKSSSLTAGLFPISVGVFSQGQLQLNLGAIVWPDGTTAKPVAYWTPQATAPRTVISNVPLPTVHVSVNFPVKFVLSSSSAGPDPIVRIDVMLNGQGPWLPACVGAGPCDYSVTATAPGIATLAARAINQLGVVDLQPAEASWSVQQCGDGQLADVAPATGVLSCVPCPAGGDCRGGAASVGNVVALRGFWASSQSNTFYSCPLPAACAGGVAAANTSIRASCADGYTGVMCGTCQAGYFLQFDKCSSCPPDPAIAWVAVVGLTACVVVVGLLLLRFRALLPQTTMKIGLSLLQILATANTSFTAPWPDAVVSFATGLKLSMLEVLTLARTGCTVPLTFYASFSFVVFGCTAVSCALLLASFMYAAGKKLAAKPGTAASWVPTTVSMVKPLFMFWLLCYPAVSLKLVQVFDCIQVEGVSLLVEDMRLTCGDTTWLTYAVIAGVYLVLFTVGLPLCIALFMYRHRFELTQHSINSDFGFLFRHYGVHAYAWEPVELLRKLILTAGLSLLDKATPLALIIAVLVSSAAHVVHGVFKPFAQRQHYVLQHAALTIITLTYAVGLVFKAQGFADPSQNLALGLALISVWGAVILAMVLVGVWEFSVSVRQYRRRQRHGAGLVAGAGVELQWADSTHAAAGTVVENPLTHRA